ncbi:MAG: superoxide dismutase [Fe], partial [bacterium]|nr:superoxide dismutase [Fe] [bacterium]
MVHVLPDLKYAKNALAPHISAETLEFHHDKHHAAYVANLNNLIPGT